MTMRPWSQNTRGRSWVGRVARVWLIASGLAIAVTGCRSTDSEPPVGVNPVIGRWESSTGLALAPPPGSHEFPSASPKQEAQSVPGGPHRVRGAAEAMPSPKRMNREAGDASVTSGVSVGRQADPGPRRDDVAGSGSEERPRERLLAAPAFDEELWIIAKGDPAAERFADDQPGGGGLVCVPVPGQPLVPVTLEHTDVRASISGWIGCVTVTQKFHNPFASKIEAVYVFPLPENAAVQDFIMTVGERRIRGVVREREEAERLYLHARARGHAASLMTQERPNVFTQKVANIEPGRGIDITITYFHAVSYHDDAFEFVFPMVVGPRFNPPAMSMGGPGAGVGAVPQGVGGVAGEAVDVPSLRPGERSGHDIALAVEIEAGSALGRVESPSHAVDISRPTPTRAVVTLGRRDRVPNKDFVLRYSLAGDGVRTGVVTHADAEGLAFAAMIVPPAELSSLPRRRMEMVFLVDCSGSMNGYPLEKAKAAIEHVVRKLGPDDTFQIIRFAAEASRFASAPVPASPENVRRGIGFVRGLSPGGGTFMIEGIRAALSYPHDPARERVVCFLTDGFIGNEAEILAEVRGLLGPSHIFSFGVGSSVNRYLMDSLARVGRGAVAYVGLNDDVAHAMDAFFDRVSRAALTDLSLDFGGAATVGVYPRRLPDLYVGRPVLIVGRLAPGRAGATLTIRGRCGGTEMVRGVAVGPAEGSNHAVAALWARNKIGALEEERLSGDSPELIGEIRRIALRNNLVSAFTAFIAVDSLARTGGEFGTTVRVPVQTPEGVTYETTVPER